MKTKRGNGVTFTGLKAGEGLNSTEGLGCDPDGSKFMILLPPSSVKT
jgi:hypothetical protein